jgi:hypothetical protein
MIFGERGEKFVALKSSAVVLVGWKLCTANLGCARGEGLNFKMRWMMEVRNILA